MAKAMGNVNPYSRMCDSSLFATDTEAFIFNPTAILPPKRV